MRSFYPSPEDEAIDIVLKIAGGGHRKFATQLLGDSDPDGSKLGVVERNHRGDVEGLVDELFRTWLKEGHASWLGLVEALESADYVDLAISIKCRFRNTSS